MEVNEMSAYAPEGAVVMSSSFVFVPALCSIGLVGYLPEDQCSTDCVFS